MSILFDIDPTANGKEGKGKGKRRNKRKEREDPEEERKRELDNLMVIGYESRLFQDDHTRKWVEGGAHLIPWFGDKERMVDRYDVRLLLDSPKLWGSGSSNKKKERTQQEIEEEKLCDYERYFDLEHAEEAREKEEEEKRRKMELKGGFHSVPFSYSEPVMKGETEVTVKRETEHTGHTENATRSPTESKTKASTPEDENRNTDFLTFPFLQNINLNDSTNNNNSTNTLSFKQQIVIENTARFIAQNDGLNGKVDTALRQKVQHNPLFSFLKPSDPLHKYYLRTVTSYPSSISNTTLTESNIKITTSTTSTTTTVQSVESHENQAKEKEETKLVDYQQQTPPQSPVHGLVFYSPPSSPEQYEQATSSLIENQITNSNTHTTSNNISNSDTKTNQDSTLSTVTSPITTESTTDRNTTQSPTEHAPTTTTETSGERDGNEEGNSKGSNNDDSNKLLERVNQSLTTESRTTKSPDLIQIQTPPEKVIQIPPADIKKLIDKTANFVHQKGKKYENALISREEGNTKFLFLLPSSLWHPYYIKKLSELDETTTSTNT